MVILEETQLNFATKPPFGSAQGAGCYRSERSRRAVS